MKISRFISDARKNCPKELADNLIENADLWTNDAFYGYLIIALEDLHFPEEQIRDIKRAAKQVLDFVPAEEAERHYRQSKY